MVAVALSYLSTLLIGIQSCVRLDDFNTFDN